MKKTLTIAAATLVIGMAAWIVNTSKSSVPEKRIFDNETLRIAAIMPLSGKDAALGKKLKQGFDLIKKYNHYGKNFEFIYKDDQSQTDKISDIASRLAETGNVDAFITYASAPAEIVAPIAAKYHIMQFANTRNPAFTRYKGNYVFAPNIDYDTQLLLTAIKNRGYQTIALFSDDDFYNDLLKNTLRESISASGLRIVFDEKITPEKEDFKSLLNDAEQQNPDIYIMQLKSPHLEQFVRQLKKIAPKKPFTAAHVFSSSPKPELFEKQFWLGIGTTDDEFRKFFYRNYGYYPEQTSVIGYAAADLLLKTLSAVDNKELFYDRLKDISNRDKSPLGKLRVKERQINFQPVLQEIRKGKIIIVSE